MGTLEDGLREFMDTQYQPLISNCVVSRPPKSVTRDNELFLGFDPYSRSRVTMPPPDANMLVLGGTGKGKSNALRAIVRELVRRKRKYGEGFTIVDPHGSLVKWVRDLLVREMGLCYDKIHYLDLLQLHSVISLNNLRHGLGDPFSTAQAVMEALLKSFGATQSSDKILVARMLTKLVHAMIVLRLALTEARFFLNRGEQDRAVLRYLIGQLPEGELKSFWLYYDQFPPSQADSYAMGPANRLDSLVNVMSLRRLFGSIDTGLDPKQVMDDGDIVLADFSRDGTNITIDEQTLALALFVQLYPQVMESRTPDSSRPHTLVLDEWGTYVSQSFARVLPTSRKFGLRCILSCQSLSMLIPRDQDRTLLDLALAIPTKLILGGLPFDQAKVLAEQVYLPLLDPAQVKFQPTTLAWDPIPTPVTLRGGSRGGGTSESENRISSRSRTATRSTSVTHPLEGDGGSTADGISESEAEGESVGYTFTRQNTWSESWSEAFVTRYKERIQELPPMFKPLEEQIFDFAKRMNLNPTGCAVVSLPERDPQDVRFALMEQPDISADERERFMELVYSKPGYLDPAEAERAIAERQAKLIAAAPVQPKAKPTRVRRGQAFVVKEGS